MSFKLRDYQHEAITDLAARFGRGDTRVPLVLATGLGKTQIFTTYADQWLAENPGRRVLIIAHTDELISQARKRALQVAPRRRVGIVKANQNEVLAEIVVSSRQTLASAKRREQIKRVGLIIIDEAHHAVRTNTYGKILEHFGAYDDPSPVVVAGFTATLARSDKAKLSSVWQDCTFTRDILFGIRNGYLLDVRGERITVPDMDMSRVRIKAGDFSDTDLAEELERTFAPEVIARDYARLADGRRGIAFWPLVETAHHGAKAFEDAGIRSGVVSGVTPKPERRELLARFHLPLTHPEAIDVMHNAMVLTEGFDEPTADVVVIARPTRSAPLYQQMVGRVLRPDLTIAPELRQKALVLDVTGASDGNVLRSLIDLSPERKLKQTEDTEEMSLLELDEYQLEIEEDLGEKRAGATTFFDSEAYDGETIAKAFDPLGRSKVWGQTPAGHYFIKAGSVAYVFLVPSIEGDPGTYDIVMCSPHSYVRDGVVPWARGTEHRGLSLEMALGWGEDVALSVGGQGTATLTGRKSKWRGGAPSEAQMKYACGLRIPGVQKNEDGTYVSLLSKGELSEAIDAIGAARRIDPLVKVVTGA
jgi:superfamily II DNA or RNA helicase